MYILFNQDVVFICVTRAFLHCFTCCILPEPPGGITKSRLDAFAHRVLSGVKRWETVP